MKYLHVLLFLLVNCFFCYGQIDTVRFKVLSNSFANYIYQDMGKIPAILKEMDEITKIDTLSLYRVNYMLYQGITKQMTRDIPASIKIFQETLNKSRLLKLEDLEVRSAFNLASAYGEAGQLNEAIHIFREFEETIKKKGKDQHGVLQKLYSNLSSLYLNLNEIESAYRYNDLQKKNSTSRNDSVLYYLNRFALLEHDKKHHETINLGNEVLTKIAKIDEYYLQQYYFYIAQAHLKLNNYSQGSKYLFKAKELAESLQIESSSFYSCLADYYKDIKDYNNAILNYNKLKSISIADGSLVMYIEALDGLASVYESTGEYKKGLEMKNQLFILADSLNGIEKRKTILDLNAKYKLKEKERTIAQHKKENQLQQESMKAQEERKNTLLVLLLVSILFLGFAIYLLRKIKKSNERIFRQRNKISEYAGNLEEANKMRDKLFAIIGHDLRSPISSLSNTLSLYNEEKKSKLLENTLLSLSNIQLILNNLLKWANLQITSAEPIYTEVNIEVLLESIIKQVTTQASAKSIQIITDYTHTHEARTDEHYLQIALRNILTNAVKFTPEQGGIKVSTRESSEGISISIRDSGIGIPADSLPGLFNYPLSTEGTAGEKGTGLGLSLTKELLEKVSGKITVKSKLGIGTEVTILMPVRLFN